MTNQSFVVIRLVPESPVDGTTFGYYLNDLSLQLVDAYTGNTVTNQAFSSPLSLFPWPPGSGTYVSVASALTTGSPTYNSTDYGKDLEFTKTDGISVGSFVVSADQTTIPPGQNLQVSAVTSTKVTLSGGLPHYVPPGTPVSFVGQPQGDVDLTTASGFAIFTLKPESGTGNTLKFPPGKNDTYGIPMGATLDAIPGLVASGTTVTGAADANTLTITPDLEASLPAGQKLTFRFKLSTEIVQHTETLGVSWSFWFGEFYAVVPAAAATVVLPLTETKPDYLDVRIKASRLGLNIPDSATYYNVNVTNAAVPPPELYQFIPDSETSLYLALPPPPNPYAVLVDIPSDGTPPAFDTLLEAMTTALTNDPIDGVTLTTLVNKSAHCRRIAYDIVWSVQTTLPLLPDPLESLYTNPPNSGGGGSTTNTSNNSGSNNYEMDRQKFEGALKSFYSTRNASAERLTKFVAAASGALACEGLSRSATTALLAFPVDPSTTLTTAVESEILLEGLGIGGPSGLDFGVPAAFFYVLGASLDKSTTAAQRFQIHAGDAIERLLQQFGTAQDTDLLGESQSFSGDGLSGLNPVTPFQAARRLSALMVSAASGSPSATVLAGSPLASLVKAWLGATDPGGTQDPPPTYQEDDFAVWSRQLAVKDPDGYLELDLDTLTRGFVIPPFAASPIASTTSGSTLTFAPGSGIGVGMPVSGPGLAPGTTVTDVKASGAVTVSPAVTGTVATTSLLVFNYSVLPLTASTSSDCPKGQAELTFAGTTGIAAGMTVLGAGLALGTTVLSVTATAVTLSTGVTADVPTGTTIAFAIAPGSTLSAVHGTTTGSCAKGTSVLTFGATTGICVGMTVTTAAGLPAGTTVLSVTGTTVAISQNATANIGLVQVTFGLAGDGPLPTLGATTTQDAPSGTQQLTFFETGSISVGMSAFGEGLTTGSTVTEVAATTVKLSAGVAADVPIGSLITFAFLPSSLADQITAWLPSATKPATQHPTVATLRQVTAAQWTGFFAQPGSPQWLPPFTRPINPGLSSAQTTTQAGYVATRIRAWVRAVQQFFTVSTVATQAQLPKAGTAPTFDVPAYDPIMQAAQAMGGYTFGNALSSTGLAAAAHDALPGDPAGQAWLIQAMTTINELFEVAGAALVPAPTSGTLPPNVSFTFSVMEALYARGFLSAADIMALSQDDFQLAMTGTVAYDSAAALWGQAQQMAQQSPADSQPGTTFQPVNPDGSLVNCVPPPCLSPTGPIAYLQEMLTLSSLSTCADPARTSFPLELAQTADEGATVLAFYATAGVRPGLLVTGSQVQAGTTVSSVSEATATVTVNLGLSGQAQEGTSVTFAAPTLDTVLGQRRGPLGTLKTSCVNLETPLPLIDLVNECLEYLGASAAPAGGAVYETTTETPDVLPEHSTPGAPGEANAEVEPAVFNKLKADFSACVLPYSQALDVSRTYLRALGSSRFEEMRTFRRDITEFVLAPTQDLAGFQPWQWRYPVHTTIAIEYLGITPEEYTTLFLGNEPAQVLRGEVGLPAFMAETCLSYCEFYELWQSGFVTFRNGASRTEDGAFPECEPCCPEELSLQFSEELAEHDLAELLVFVRLWRKLRESSCGGYSFAHLRDICDVLHLQAGGVANPDFIRQLAALQMLRDDFGLDLVNPAAPVAPNAIDAERTHMLALWAEPPASQWPWAVQQLITRVEERARREHRCERRSPEFLKLLTDNLEPLSRLAGFDPGSSTDSWHARPTHTLRFAEVLAKICASRFGVGELIYLFTAGPHLDGDDPFPLQDQNEALDAPLGLPDDEEDHALWRLRRELLAARDDADGAEAEEADGDREEADADAEADEWPWRRIESALEAEFGFAAADITALGQHFFHGVLARAGQAGGPGAERFASSLPAVSTSAPMWNNPPDGPLSYDSGAEQLTARIPLTDRAVITKLTAVRDLNPDERKAVQDLFFQPRALLARFALLFADFADAQRALIEERDEGRRFSYFRRQFLACRRRAHLIARHLTRHVVAVTGQEGHGDDEAALILRTMAADENAATTKGMCPTWECDSGAPPELTWARPAGSALAALLGLAGTGLTAEYRSAGGEVVWRDGSAALCGFGAERDRENCPVPTVLPALDAPLTAQQLRFASVRNGFLMQDATGAWLGGAQGFSVTWSGALLIEREGTYEFWAGAPTPGEDRPDADRDAASGRQWRVVLRRGQRTWVILSHHWAGEEEHGATALPLKRGAYELTAELVQSVPEFGDEDEVRPQHTGFRVEYSGPDSDGRRTEIPHRALFAVRKGPASAIEGLSPGAAEYLNGRYASSLRDIRRTYQRAFKALLFCHRLGLSARREPHGSSELGCLLAQPQRFAGSGYYRGESGFARHGAYFDVDFLPLRDDYQPPVPGTDARTDPSPQRVQAMFDWWERLFDYTAARADVRRRSGRSLWLLFEEAEEKQPAKPGYLLRHMAADARHWPLDLRYFQDQGTAVYEVSSADLADERWVMRAWRADGWLRGMQDRFPVRDVTTVRPDLWASDDPSAKLPTENQTGNANLLAFVTDSYLADGDSRHHEDFKRLNDGLRERGRRALIAYLCHKDRVPLPWTPGAYATAPGDLSDLLLFDVEAGLRERASRIEEGITAAQTYFRRARLGLEPDWTVTREFARLWDSRFETYRTWERARRRELYQENWIEWDELARARRIEAFRFLESKLRSSTLTMAAPGGLDWWADDDRGLERAPRLLQRRVPSELTALPAAPVTTTSGGGTVQPTTREGFTTLGRPEFAGEPTWLTAVPQPTLPGGSGGNGGTEGSGGTQGSGGSQSSGGTGGSDQTQVTVRSLAVAAAAGSTQPESLPLWLESAMKLGTRFVRVAAAGVPQAAFGFVPYGEEHHGACCRECGRDHPAGVDEYYFWLIDAQVYDNPGDSNTSENDDASFTGTYQLGFQDPYYDQFQQQSAEWNDGDQVSALLAKWQPGPAVRLAWCRVHQGKFGPPRRSEGYVALTGDQLPDLVFLGRAWDSLYLEVIGAKAAGNGSGPGSDTSPPGFRYDLPSDLAVALPEVLEPAPPAAKYPGGLTTYPFFAYEEPGARLFPASWFSTSLIVAGALRARCGYDLALRWYRRAFDPLQRDCAWMHCEENADSEHRTDQVGACCDSTKVTEQVARDRAVTLHYSRTLIEHADALMRRGRAPEAFQQARVLYDTAARIAGPRPRTIQLPEPASVSSVASFVPAYAPLNPELMRLYDLIADRRELIHRTLDASRIRTGRDVPYFGPGAAECDEEEEWCGRPSPYRFLAQIPKAIELAGRVKELGGMVLAAHEKGDAEYLASVHAVQEREMQALGIAIRQDQWRDADWQVQALQQAKDMHQANLIYYASLYQNGLLNNEIQNLDLTTNALMTRTGANVVEAAGEILNIIPDPFVGAMSSGASVPAGTKLAHMFQAIGRIMQTVADIQSTTAGMDMTQAGWQRRAVDWMHQIQTLPIQIQQTEMQLLGAHRHRDELLRELNNQQRHVEHTTEVLDFLRDKFTATDLYLWMLQETAALHCRMYELALHSAHEAQRAFNLERGHTRRRFIPEETWDSLHDGLLAGERLEFALRHMEKAYLDENRREYELTKHISLRLQFPVEFLRLRITGQCEIDIREWMLDLDWPGHYMRRIKEATVTVATVAGPYTGVHCRLTLLSSMTRIHPELRPPAHRCCCEGERGSEYEACPDDPRIVREYTARESIATSSGQNDSGLFELNFRDERLLPFEYRGAAGRWRFELRPENNYFPLDAVSEVVLHLGHTAWEGGEALRAAAFHDARHRLPGDGLRLFDLRHDFTDAWAAAWRPDTEDRADGGDHRRRHRSLRMGLTPAMFPFVPGRRVHGVDRLLLVFEAPDARPGRHHLIRFWWHDAGHERVTEVTAVADGSWPGYFCGTVDLRENPLGPLRDERPAECGFDFPTETGEVRNVFVIAAYTAEG
jgi:hypothetical protein